MELRHLRYFIAVAEELNFTRAAARLHIAQPPLSVQIKKLEAEIGAHLFLRKGRNIALTEAGRVFLDEARGTLAQADKGVALARRAAKGEVGHLTIGYNTVAEFKVFPKIIPAFRKQWPDVHLSFREFEIGQQLDALRRNEVDVGFVWLPFPDDEFDVQELIKASLIAVLPTSHPLSRAATVSVKNLSSQPLILFSRALDPRTPHQIEELFLRAGAVLNVVLELDSLLSMINFVAIGTGCALLPDYLRSISREGLVHKNLRGPNLSNTMAIVKKKEHEGLIDTFYRFAIDTLRQLDAEEHSAWRSRRNSHNSTQRNRSDST